MDLANISSIYATCGLMKGVPHRVDGGLDIQPVRGSRWSASLYSCASALRADIRTVSFLLNGTGSTVEDLIITEIHGKEYEDNFTMPLWGVEDPGLTRSGITLIWGLISPEYKNFPNISILQKPALYLPGRASDTYTVAVLVNGGREYLPGSDFATYSMNSVFGLKPSLPHDPIPDYSGATDMAMFLRWQNLSSNSMDASNIVNLMWTDIAAQGVVGTKGTLGSGNADSETEGSKFVVQPIRDIIKYHWPFGIPAIVLLSLLALTGLINFASTLAGKSSFLMLQKRLNQTSIGRIITSYQYPSHSDMAMSSADWSKAMGSVQVDMSAPLRHSECQPVEDNGT